MNRRLLELLADKRIQRALLLVLLWLPAVIVLIVVREVLLPFLLAFALAYVITPPVRWLSAQRLPFTRAGYSAPGPLGPGRPARMLPRWASVLVLYAVAGTIIWIGGRIFVPQLYKEVTRLTKESSEIFHQLSDENIALTAKKLEAWIDKNDLPIHIVTAEDEDGEIEDPQSARAGTLVDIDVVGVSQDLIRNAKQFARDQALQAASQVQNVLAATLRFVFSAFLVLMLTAFIVADAGRITSFLFTITPLSDREKLHDMLGRIDRGLSGVVRGQLTICLINGVLTLIGLLLLKVKFAFLLATLAAIFSLIPIFGSILSTIPIVIVGLSSGLTTAVLAVSWIVGIHALEANFLNPKIMGDAAKIHPVLVVLALVIGERFYGLAGALFAVPLMSALVTIWKAVRQRAMRLDDEIGRTEVIVPVEPRVPMRKLKRSDGG